MQISQINSQNSIQRAVVKVNQNRRAVIFPILFSFNTLLYSFKFLIKLSLIEITIESFINHRTVYLNMGNSTVLQNPVNQIDQLNLPSQEKSNLQIYVWRASFQTNQYIPRTSFNSTSVSEVKKQLFSCMPSKNSITPNITFQKYVCDFKPLAGFLDLSQSLTLFQYVLKGHQSIYSKFNSTIIHEKCCFLTHDGQARIWINPNYFLNNFWITKKKQLKLKTSSVHQINCQTPRFMDKQQFDFQTITALSSEGVIIRKIIEWMPKFVKRSRESIEFWSHLQKFIQGNMLNNCSFDQVERFIHMWAYQKKIPLKSTIQDTVKKLIKEGKILKDSEKITEKCSKRRLSTNHTDRLTKQHPNLTITVDNEFDGVSVFDIKNVESQHICTENQNLSKILGKSSKIGNHSERKISIENDSRFGGSGGEYKISINDKKLNHRRKISNQSVNTKVEPMIDSQQKIEQVQSARSVVYQNVDFWSVKSKQHSLQDSASAKNKFNLSYQYSICLINSQINKVPQNQSGKEKQNLKASTDDSEMNKFYESEHLRPRNNSKTGSILKKNQMKSFQVKKQKTLNIDQKDLNCKNKNSVIFQTETIPIANQNEQIKNSKQSRFSTFGVQSGEEIITANGSILKGMSNQAKENQLKMGFKLSETKRTADHTYHNSCLKTQNLEFYPFRQITNYETFQVKGQAKGRVRISDTSIYSGEENTFKGQTSMMVNMNYLEDGIQEDIFKSKRRISVGAEGEMQRIGQENYQDEYGKMSIINNPAGKTHKTINRLFSSQNKLQTSFGSISSGSNQFCCEQKMGQKYSGILSKMGRSVEFRKVSEIDLEKPSQFEIGQVRKGGEEMSNFMKKRRTICEHGSQRSMKF